MHPGSAPDLGNAPDPRQIRYLEFLWFAACEQLYIDIAQNIGA